MWGKIVGYGIVINIFKGYINKNVNTDPKTEWLDTKWSREVLTTEYGKKNNAAWLLSFTNFRSERNIAYLKILLSQMNL